MLFLVMGYLRDIRGSCKNPFSFLLDLLFVKHASKCGEKYSNKVVILRFFATFFLVFQKNMLRKNSEFIFARAS